MLSPGIIAVPSARYVAVENGNLFALFIHSRSKKPRHERFTDSAFTADYGDEFSYPGAVHKLFFYDFVAGTAVFRAAFAIVITFVSHFRYFLFFEEP